MHPISSEEYRQEMLNALPEKFILELIHDLRGRISMATTAAEMLQEGIHDEKIPLTDEETDRLIEIILKSGNDLLNLVNILQDYEKFGVRIGKNGRI